MVKIEELVVKAKNGDKEAFSELINSMYSDLYRVARSRLQNDDDAQDAVQEAVINAYLNIDKLEDDTKFKKWIMTTLVNECNHIYRKKKRKNEVSDECLETKETDSSLEDNIDFEEMLSYLGEKEKEIFKYYYEDRLTTKQIAKILGMNENTVKTILKRGKEKIKKSYKPATIFVFILCIFIATSVLAVSIISYIKSLFEVNSVGIENAGVQMAIENMDWYQEVDMDYIDMGNGYKVKVEYLLMDEMNLYLIFDFESEEDLSKYTDVSILDLKITNENGDLICDKWNALDEQLQKGLGDKLIENTGHSMKLLVYMYTESFPETSTLDIGFTKVKFYKKHNENIIDTDINFRVILSDKFINRSHTLYTSKENMVKKAMVSETGFYAIISTNKFKALDIKLIDEEGNEYTCWKMTLTSYDSSNTYEEIIVANFNNIEDDNLKLLITDNGIINEIELSKINN